MAAVAAMQLAEAPAAVNAYGQAFRDYSVQETPRQIAVAAFYAEQHAKQTFGFVAAQKATHAALDTRTMSIWEAAGARARGRALTGQPASSWRLRSVLTARRCCTPELLNEVVDDSDPDLDLPQARWRRQAKQRAGIMWRVSSAAGTRLAARASTAATLRKGRTRAPSCASGATPGVGASADCADCPDTPPALQLQHLLQTAEALRAAYPEEEWLHLTGFIHGARPAAGACWTRACANPRALLRSPTPAAASCRATSLARRASVCPGCASAHAYAHAALLCA
jgi:hypothetical protein